MTASSPPDTILVVGASEHNLQNINITLPRDTLTVFTGVSGSGKSSLAFDTLFKEGQRRFMESLSPYARQFLGQMEKPRVEHVEGLSPTISIDQKTVTQLVLWATDWGCNDAPSGQRAGWAATADARRVTYEGVGAGADSGAKSPGSRAVAIPTPPQRRPRDEASS